MCQTMLRALHLWPHFFSLATLTEYVILISLFYQQENWGLKRLSNLLGRNHRTNLRQSQDLSPGRSDPPVWPRDLCCYPLVKGMSTAPRKHKNCWGSLLVNLWWHEEQPWRAFPISSNRDPSLHPPSLLKTAEHCPILTYSLVYCMNERLCQAFQLLKCF